MTGDVELIGAVDTVHGAAVRVYHDHDGARIDAGGAEFMLSIDAARDLANHLMTAVIDALGWEAARDV